MKKFASFLSVAFLPTFALLAGCSSSEPEEVVTTSEAAMQSVDPSKCPRELRVQVGASVAWLAPTPTEAYGHVLTATERERVRTAMREAETFAWAPLAIEASRPLMTPSTCTYRQGDATAILRTKAGGGVELAITKGYLYGVADVERMAPEGIRFDAHAVMNLQALLSDFGSSSSLPRTVSIGTFDVQPPGEQLMRWAQTPALRIPVLNGSRQNLHELEPSFIETMVIDREHAPMKYVRYGDQVASSGVELLSHASPVAFQTTDPDTSICYLGPAEGVCEILASFSGTVFGDGFTFAGGHGETCRPLSSLILMTFHTAASPIPVTTVIPPCR